MGVDRTELWRQPSFFLPPPPPPSLPLSLSLQRVLVVGDVIISASDDYDLRLWDFGAPGRPGPAG